MRIEKKITLKAKEGKANELRSLLVGMIKPSIQENGCIKYELFQIAEEPGSFFLIEAWEDEEALMGHKKSNHFSDFKESIDELVAEKSSISISRLE